MRVTAVDLHGEAPLALRESLRSFELAIDFSRPPEELAAALTELFQDAVDAGRWQRHATSDCAHRSQPESSPPV